MIERERERERERESRKKGVSLFVTYHRGSDVRMQAVQASNIEPHRAT